MKINISVIVPIYNVEKYIEKCLKKLEEQTFETFEILAISDGSPDNSAKIVKEYQKKYSNIKFIEKKNGGYGSVLEYAIKNIKTKYFLICDPDDWLAKDCLKDLYNFAQKKDLDIVVGDRFDVYTDDNSIVKQAVKPKKITSIKPKKVYSKKEDIYMFSFFDVSPHAKLYKTELVKNIKFPHHVSYTDFLLYIVALSHAKKIAYFNKPLAYYLRDRPGNTVTDIRRSIINDYTIVWEETFNDIKDESDNSILLYRLYTQLRFILAEYKRVSISGFNNQYWEEILKSILILQSEKRKIKKIPYFEKKKINKIFLKLFLNRFTSNFIAKVYVKLKK